MVQHPVRRALALAVLLLAALSPAAQAGDCDLEPRVLAPGTQWEDSGPTNYALHLRPTATVRAMLLFADFSDAAATGADDRAALEAEMVPAAEAYYQEVSYGRTTLDVASLPQWLRMPSPAASYGTRFAGLGTLVADAVAAADAAGADFSAVDVVLVATPVATPFEGAAAYIFRPGEGVSADGRLLRHAVGFGEAIYRPQDTAANVLIHELGHVFGLPDLYFFDGTLRQPAGAWDPMGISVLHAGFSAWHRRKLGWLDDAQTRCVDGTVAEATITPLDAPGGLKQMVFRTGPRTALVAEVRRKTGQDAGLCDAGVVVYSVDAAVGGGAAPGPVRVHPADATAGACGEASAAAYDPGQSFTDPATGIVVEVLAKAGDDHTVRFTSPAAPYRPPAPQPQPQSQPQPQPGPGATPAPPAAADTSAPAPTATAARRQALSSGRVALAISAAEACTLRVTARLTAGKRAYTLAPRTVQLAAGVRQTVALPLPAKARRAARAALRARKAVKVVVTLATRDAAGNAGRAQRTISLT